MLGIDDWQKLQSAGGVTDLSRMVKLRLTGPDALRYLNGQVSNDVRQLAPGSSLPACLCTHKGRLEAFVLISRANADTFFITADEALREFLPLRLEKYLIADNATLEDVTDHFALVHTFGAAKGSCDTGILPVSSRQLPAGTAKEHPAPDGLEGRQPRGHDAPGHTPAGSTVSRFQDSAVAHPAAEAALTFSANRLGAPGTDHWLPAGGAQDLDFSSPEAVETLRIDRGIPAWESELSGGILPPEARLDESAIDYHKGCYTGQEVISRIRSIGQVNRKLERLLIPGGHTAEPGWQIVSRSADDALVPAGSVTSAAWHPALQTGMALGFVKRTAAVGELLTGPADGRHFTVVEIRKTLDDQRP